MVSHPMQTLDELTEQIEERYKKNLERTPKRQKEMIKYGFLGTIAHGFVMVAPFIFPDYFSSRENIDTAKYVKIAIGSYPFFLSAYICLGALSPETHKLSSWMAYTSTKWMVKKAESLFR